MKKLWVNITGLVIVEQAIKVCLVVTGFNQSYIIGNYLFGIKLKLNTEELSMFNSRFDLNIHIIWLLALNLFGILFLISLILYKQYLKNNSTILRYSLIMYLAGAICSASDKIFFKGSLDYLVVLHYIIDLKDIYLAVGSVLLVIYVVKNLSFKAKSSNDITTIKGYFTFLKRIKNKDGIR